MGHVAFVAQANAQVVGANENPVNAFGLCDAVKVFYGQRAFDLHNKTELFGGSGDIALHLPVARRARHTRGTSHARRCVSHCHHSLRRLFCGLNVGHKQSLGTHIQQALEQNWIISSKSNHRRAVWMLPDRLQGGKNLHRFNRGMFTIDWSSPNELISQRYERGSTLITSNLPFEEWTETFGTGA